jgi:hypothetical protein
MLLKRIYATPAGWVKEVNAAGDCINPPPCTGVEVKHTGHSRDQHFSDRLVLRGLQEGWMEMTKDEAGKAQLILKGTNGALHYSVLRGPGKYPTSIPTADDPGYEVIHYFDCVLDEADHAKFSVQKGKV